MAPAPPVTFSRARLHLSGFKNPVLCGHHRFSFQTPQGGLRLHGQRFTHKPPEMQGPCSGPHSPHATCVDTVPGATRDMWRGAGYLCVDFIIQFHFPLRSQISQLVVFLGIRKRALLTCEVEVNLMLIMRWNVMVTRRQMTVSPATQEKASVERVWPPCLQRELAPHHLLKLRGGLVSCVSARGPRLTQRPRGALSPLPALSRVFVLHTPQTLPSLIFRRRLSGE